MDTVTVIIDSCRVCATQHAVAAKSYGDSVSSNCNAVWITLIICLTALLMGLIIEWWIYTYKKNNQAIQAPNNEEASSQQKSAAELREEDDRKTRKVYQDRLIGFMEKRAIKKETTVKDEKKTEITREFDKDRAEDFIKRLEEIIKDLAPTQKP